MKLHLPTALFALAVLPAVAFAEENPYFIIDDYTDQYTEITNYITDGHIQITVDKAVGGGKAGAIGPNSENRKGNIAIIRNSLSLGEGDYITGTSNSKVLYIDGDLSLSGGATAKLTGPTPGATYAGAYNKAGILAENVSIGAGSTLELEAARFNTLSVNNGTVKLKYNFDNGGTLYGAGYDIGYSMSGGPNYAGVLEFSNVAITNGLKVEGDASVVEFGRQTANPGNLGYLGAIGEGTGKYQSTIGGSIVQTGGTLKLHGMTYLSTEKITQTGGTMEIATNGKHTPKGESTSYYGSYLKIGQDKMTVSQENGTLNLQGVIIKGTKGNDALQLIVEQTGSGEINMQTSEKRVLNNKGETAGGYIGSYFTTASKETASVIKQSGSGTININSDYTSATFNVEQTGKGGNITIGANGKLQSNALTLTDASTFTIARSENGGLTLNKDAEVTFAVSSLVSTYTGNTGGLVVEDGKNFIAEGLVSVKVVFSDDVVMAALTGLTSAENQVLGSCQEVLIATGDVSNALTFSTGTYEKEYDLGNGTTATVEFDYDFIRKNNQVFANVTATVTGTGTTPAVPEPATATLSLLALAGLCARRRRK